MHLGLGSLLAWRLARDAPNTFSISINDYGFELLSAQPVDPAPLRDQSLFDDGDLLHDVLASLNSSELARRRFREIARVAGLIFTGYPGPAEEHAPAAGVERAVLRGVPQVRRRQPAADAGARARC